MRPKTRKLVITFRTTSQAIAAERLMKERGLPGRLIPVPRQITAGCGMAWAAPPEAGEALKQALESDGWEGWYELVI